MDKYVKDHIHSPEFKEIEPDLLEYQGLVYVPMDRKLRGDIISHHHDTRLAGHYGEFKTVAEIKKNYWWPTMYRDVKTYTKGCETCQKTKSKRIPKKTPLHPFDPPERPWEVITLDLIGPIPMSEGRNAILVIVDWLSKAIKLEATNMTLNSEGFAKILRDRVIRDHGLFHRIIHDRDTRFTSEYTTDLLKALGINQNVSTAYHPQTDGQTERMNQTVETYLRTFISYHQDDWKDWISLAEFSYNNSVHVTTKQTPFFINYGRHPWTGTDVIRQENKDETPDQFATRMKKVQEEAAIALRMANEKTKHNWDKNARKPHEYSPGDLVYIEATNIKTGRPSRKLDYKRFGPFEVVKKVGLSAYEIKLPPSWKGKTPNFNETYLTPYHDPQFPQQKKPPPPPPIELEGQGTQYEIEEILDVIRLPSRKRRQPGKLKYHVHWKGYDNPEDHTWELAEEMENAQEIVDEYHRNHPDEPGPGNRIRALQMTRDQETRLFNTDTNAPGRDFVMPLPTLDLTPEILIRLDSDTIRHFTNAPGDPNLLWLMPRPPPTTRRVWVYDTDTRQISHIIDLNHQHVPVRMWFLLNPCTFHTMLRKYEYVPRQQMAVAPAWLRRDYGKHIQWVW